MSPRVIGVRHHSPACARLVQHVIAQVKPSIVLIEGPADMNGRLDELCAEHQLPIAIFSYHRTETGVHSSWSPLCDYSPEWVALREGRRVGAQVKFMDLPAWAPAFGDIANRYADGTRPRLSYVASLCSRLGMDGMDSLWDHLFELPLPPEELEARLAPYFEALRDSGGDAPADQERESFMVRCVASAMAETDNVVVVCGGYHKPHIERAWKHASPHWPTLPVPEHDARHGSYLVPYSFRRLDSFVGYQSGMPSPGYYQAVWEQGAAAAARAMLESAVLRLRSAKQPVSSADLIAAETMSHGLMRLRGHDVMSRTDLLDGLSSALVKNAQDVRLPWTERGPLRAGTDPIVVELVAALSGEREGRLAKDTPLPPLVADADRELRRLDLLPERNERSVELNLTDPRDLSRSQLLQRLVILGVSGFVLAPSATDELDECWVIRRTPEQPSDFVEAGGWGGSVEAAAGARLEAALREPDVGIVVLSQVLHRAVTAGLLGLIGGVVQRMEGAVQSQTDSGELGEAVLQLLGIWRHDALHGAVGHDVLARVLGSAFDRGLWLFEGLQGATAALDGGHVRAALALRDCMRYGLGTIVPNPEAAHGVMRRRMVDPVAPPAVRGAALGVLWSLRQLGARGNAERHAISAIRASATPTQLGDFLTGVFVLAREEVTDRANADDNDQMLKAIDLVLQCMSQDDFLAAIPSLRMAFSFFPPREKDALARRVLKVHGRGSATAGGLRRLTVSAETLVAASRLESRIEAVAERYGLTEGVEADDG